MRRFADLPPELRQRIRRLSPRASACWRWIGPRHYHGRACSCLSMASCKCYGRQSWPIDPHDLSTPCKNWLAHRLVYTLLIGPVDPDLVLDHLKAVCCARWCVRPDHLEPVTNAENTRRGGGRFGSKRFQPLPTPTRLTWLEDEVPF